MIDLGTRVFVENKAVIYVFHDLQRLQGYVDAADIFQKESNTKPGVDLAAITDRMEIRKAVQSGDIQQAIERVNDLNPEVSRQGIQRSSLNYHIM